MSKKGKKKPGKIYQYKIFYRHFLCSVCLHFELSYKPPFITFIIFDSLSIKLHLHLDFQMVPKGDLRVC